MEAEEYRRRLLASAAASQAAANMLLQMLPKHPTPEQWSLFIKNLYPQVMEARRQAFNLSTEFYTSQRQAQGARGSAPRFVERNYPIERLERAMKPVRARLVGLDDFEVSDAEVQKAEREAEGIVERHGIGAGRSAVEDAVKRDANVVGFARVPSGAETCAFCTMLVSRGVRYGAATSKLKDGVTTYTSQKSGRTFATDTADLLPGTSHEPYHNHCDCIVVPVFNKKNWPGQAEYFKAKELWNTHGSLKALREHLNSAEDRTSGA